MFRGLCVCLSVCLSVLVTTTALSCAKTAEPIEVPLGIWTQIGLRNTVLNEGHDLHTGEQFWVGVCHPL